MLSAGKRIRDAHDKLSRIEASYLFESIRQPSREIENQIKSLRLVYGLDKKRYNELKRELPYVVCAAFNPEYRLTQNFAFTDCFIIDIDHVGSQSISLLSLKMQLSLDQRVTMAFISPSGDGLKLLFRLKEKCYDAGAFSAFYKVFVQQYALQYDLINMIDSRTSDVCRACFISHDPEVYFNPNAELIDWKRLADQSASCNLAEAPEHYGSPRSDKQTQTKGETAPADSDDNADPDTEIMERIKQQLKLSRAREKAKRDFFVPEEIEEVMTGLREVIAATGITITGERNIQYGKQLELASNLRKAELNIFFGRRGFSVVESTRRNTSKELNHMMGELVRDYLASFSN